MKRTIPSSTLIATLLLAALSVCTLTACDVAASNTIVKPSINEEVPATDITVGFTPWHSLAFSTNYIEVEYGTKLSFDMTSPEAEATYSWYIDGSPVYAPQSNPQIILTTPSFDFDWRARPFSPGNYTLTVIVKIGNTAYSTSTVIAILPSANPGVPQ